MHEQVHKQSTKTDSTEPYKDLPGDMDAAPKRNARAEAIREISEPMRVFALNNPCLTHDALEKAIQSGTFGRFIQVKNTVGIYAILTVSPEDETNALFWHCSMSINNSVTCKPKSLNLWTRRENLNIRDLLKNFLGDCGMSGNDHFMKTKTALHISRALSFDELEKITNQAEANQQ